MYVREHKKEASRQAEDNSDIDKKYKSEDLDEDRQNAHKIRFDSHLDIVNKADIKKFSGKTLRLSIHEIQPVNDIKLTNTKGKKESINVKTFHPVQECPGRSKFKEEAVVY